MRTYPDVRFRELGSEADRARQLLDDSRFADARDAFTAVRVRAAKLGLDSAYLAWSLAIALDMNEETEMAFKVIEEAIAKDPLNPQTQRSFGIIAGKLRQAVADAATAGGDPSIARIYRLLLEAGEADVACHIGMARHLAAAGDHAGALRLLDAVTLLAPVSRDAWLAKAATARAAGDESLAVECDGHAAALATTDVPFGIPGARGEC